MRTVLALLLLGAAVAHAQSVCQTYVVQPNDNIYLIAERFGVSSSDLETALTQCIRGYTPGTYLQPQQKICLPPWYDACANVRIAGGEGQGWDQCKYYKVQPGDTLENIALNLGLNRIDVEDLNPEASMLQVNDHIKLPGWFDGCPAPGDTQPCRYYVAQTSDSLSSIAISFSVDLAELQSVNQALSVDTTIILQPGQRVNIPPFDETTCGGGVEVSKPTSGNCNAYRVNAGDTLYSIAAAFQTTTQQLLDINPALAAGGVLTPGSEVYIPPYVAEDCAAGVNYVTPIYALPSPSPSPSPAADAGAVPQSLPSPPTEDEAAPSGEGAPDAEVVADTPAPAPAPESDFGFRRRLLRN